VWHPGGAHPFIGLNEALVHNGDFANYRCVTDYLRQRNIEPLFLTDTEVSVQLFDLLVRVYGYPLEYVIEALAPTTELDFDLLPQAKQKIYRRIQASHIAGSPDGPWFFIIARNDTENNQFQLIGITDTAMLRPQVFALQDGQVQIGLVASEKQAIDATLESLAGEDERFTPIADRYWNARGGSHTDGGAFIFTLNHYTSNPTLTCTDKFDRPIEIPAAQQCRFGKAKPTSIDHEHLEHLLDQHPADDTAVQLFELAVEHLADWTFENLAAFCQALQRYAANTDDHKQTAIDLLTLLNDRKYPVGHKKPASVLEWIRQTLCSILLATPEIASEGTGCFHLIDCRTASGLRPPADSEQVLLIDAHGFPPEGPQSDAGLLVGAAKLGWKRFIAFNYAGQRFLSCGLGPDTVDIRIDAYGSVGDYLASGMDGLEFHVHGNAQDQLGQILKSGKLVIHGDVGQTFMYGAKGGEVYVLGNAAGRPLINAVGRPRVVINGTCLDFLAESFMAGDPLNGGGFVVLNGIRLDQSGNLEELPTPYPGSNLFSMASGGAIYVRDPHARLVNEQLNGGEFANVTEEDWNLILPYLQENERLFGIHIEDLLTVYGVRRPFEQVYRKVKAVRLAVLASMLEDSED
ncbi:MAG: glutamate synthase, partial [Phycisphaerae bacterium]|nr:glutamate synthase [Phycisphaerae bacterium]